MEGGVPLPTPPWSGGVPTPLACMDKRCVSSGSSDGGLDLHQFRNKGEKGVPTPLSAGGSYPSLSTRDPPMPRKKIRRGGGGSPPTFIGMPGWYTVLRCFALCNSIRYLLHRHWQVLRERDGPVKEDTIDNCRPLDRDHHAPLGCQGCECCEENRVV